MWVAAIVILVIAVFAVAPMLFFMVAIAGTSSSPRKGDPVVQAVRRQVAVQQERPPRGLGKALTRRRWRRITRAGNRLGEKARRRAFRAVLDDWAGAGAPDDERPELLRGWAGQQEFSQTVTETAASPGYGLQASLASYCLRDGLLPEAPARRACFYALTGQHERRRAVDPDGSLLAAVYRWANHTAQHVLRDALRGEDLDAIRAIVLSDRRLSELIAEERDYLARHGLAPENPVERACFYALTGQRGQRRALDPDGSLLATGYQAASEQMRAALRQALASDGELDLVHVVAGGGRPIAQMTAEERAYLAGQLAARRDWAGLWRLARELTVREAVEALRPVDSRWRPDGQRDRELFGLLSRARADRVWISRDALLERGAVRVVVPGTVRAGALSDDGRLLAVWTHDTPPERYPSRPGPVVPGTIRIYGVPHGDLLASHAADITDHATLAFSGDALAGFTARYERSAVESWLYFCPAEDGQPTRQVFHHAYEYIALRALADRPQAAWTPSDLATVERASWLPERSPQARPFYELVRACLEHRFGGDIAIRRGAPEIGDEEIGISCEGMA